MDDNLKLDWVKRENERLKESCVTTADRLKQIMDERGLKQADIVRLCQPHSRRYNIRLGRNDLSQYLAGRSLPGQRKLFLLGRALHVNEAWLMGYDVDPTPNMNTGALDLVEGVVNRIQLKKFPMLGEIA